MNMKKAFHASKLEVHFKSMRLDYPTPDEVFRQLDEMRNFISH